MKGSSSGASSSRGSGGSKQNAFELRAQERKAITAAMLHAMSDAASKRTWDPNERAWWHWLTKFIAISNGYLCDSVIEHLKLADEADALIEEIDVRSASGCRELIALMCVAKAEHDGDPELRDLNEETFGINYEKIADKARDDLAAARRKPAPERPAPKKASKKPATKTKAPAPKKKGGAK